MAVVEGEDQCHLDEDEREDELDVEAMLDNLFSEEHQSRKRRSRDEEDIDVNMVISPEEREWAKALKEAALENEETRDAATTISDMEYVQLVLVENGDLAKALKRIPKIREFRKKYKIEDTTEQGVECIRALMQQQPGFSLDLSQDPREGHYVHVLDMAKLQPRKVHLEQDWKVWLSGTYYFLRAINPSIAATREGNILILETEGYSWDNFCIEFERRINYELVTAMPFKCHEFNWINTPQMACVAFALVKPFIPESARKVAKLGIKFDDNFCGRLDALYLQPSPELANERQIRTARTFLDQRHQNEANFRL